MTKPIAAPWYLVDNIDEVDTPALLIYPDRVQENIRTLLRMTGAAEKLRPHVKTHKSLEISKMLLQAGITKFKCATIAEAEMLAMAGAPDVLLAYQPVGPKVDRLLALQKAFPATRFSCLVDNAVSAAAISTKAQLAGLRLPVYIDVNVGMNRSGILPGRVVALFELLAETKGLLPVGLHAYDGHIRHEDFEKRKEACNAAFAAIEEISAHLTAKGYASPAIVAGGSPSFPVHAQRKDVECSPGTFIYWDYGYGQTLCEQPFLHAALVATRVISLPATGIVCTDLGHKSVAAENELGKRIHFLNAAGLHPVAQSEEHLVLQAAEDHSFQPGDVLFGIPYHICPTCALYERAAVIEGGRKVAEWTVLSRDRKIHF